MVLLKEQLYKKVFNITTQREHNPQTHTNTNSLSLSLTHTHRHTNIHLKYYNESANPSTLSRKPTLNSFKNILVEEL